MTSLVTTQADGYLDDPYLTTPYLGGTNLGNQGLQFNVIIDAQKATGTQFQGVINAQNAYGLQFQGVIDALVPTGLQFYAIVGAERDTGLQYQGVINAQNAYGLQFQGVIDAQKPLGLQYNLIDTQPAPQGLQFQVLIADHQQPYGVEFRFDQGITILSDCGGDAGYLDDAYLVNEYLVATNCGHMGLQYSGIINKQNAYGLQFNAIINAQKAIGTQYLGIINATNAYGLQFQAINTAPFGLQFTVVLYNTDNIRVLCDFPSRGTTGTNWTATSTAAGDFGVNNVNSDIVEQVWRSNGVVTGLRLTCDTGIPQGVFVDTLAILGHNFSSSANVVVEGSNVSDFSSIGTTIILASSADNTGNTYYIAPTYPLQGFRYWRISIDDAGNGDGYIEIGTILFGSAEIFQGENIVDHLEREFKDFADTVRTMGFTNVSNSRAIKKLVRFAFKNLDFALSNFRKLNAMFRRDRTTYKCLWIPTPDPVDQEYTERFAAFAKLSKIPSEQHNSKGAKADFTDLDVEVDESL